jgi:hypothetical protein
MRKFSTALGALFFVAAVPVGFAKADKAPVTAETTCNVVAAIMDADSKDEIPGVMGAVIAVMRPLDEADTAKGRGSLLGSLKGDDQATLVASATALCEQHADWTLTHAATEAYQGMRAIEAALGVSGVKASRELPSGPLVVAPISEIALAPRKYFGKPIEVRGLFCYYADVEDYRCNAIIPAAPLAVIFTKAITPAAARQAIEANCDTAQKAIRSPRCRVTLRFSYDEDDVDEDTVQNINRVIVQPDSVEAIMATGGR